MQGKKNKLSVLKVIVKCPITNDTKIVDTQGDIVAVVAKSNLCHQSQTEGIAFRIPLLLNAFDFCAENEEY